MHENTRSKADTANKKPRYCPVVSITGLSPVNIYIYLIRSVCDNFNVTSFLVTIMLQ